MNINDIYKIVSYLVDKYQGTYLSPDEFNSVINMAQRQYLNYMTEDGSGHMQMRMGRKSGMLVNAPVAESLSIFLSNISINGDEGDFQQPVDTYRIVSVRTSDDTNVIRKITYDKLAEVLNDPIDPPTETDPVYIDYIDMLRVYPNTVATINFTYIVTPLDMYWAYTGNLVYDSANSVQPQWNIKDIEDIIYRAIGIIGINLKDGDLQRAAQMVKTQGE